MYIHIVSPYVHLTKVSCIYLVKFLREIKIEVEAGNLPPYHSEHVPQSEFVLGDGNLLGFQVFSVSLCLPASLVDIFVFVILSELCPNSKNSLRYIFT